MKRLAWAAIFGLAGCGVPERTAAEFAADPDGAAQVVSRCDAGRQTRDCGAAREGLAEARREARMRAYERAF